MLASLASTIGKLSKIGGSVAQTRLQAHEVGITALKALWDNQTYAFSKQEAQSAKQVLQGLLPSILTMLKKLDGAKSQRTLLERRLRSLQYAIKALDEICAKDSMHDSAVRSIQ